MKKTIFYIAASTIGFVLMLTNCSKKADPAPAATTSTTGTTTSGTTAGSTTTSTTAGTTTTGTTAGSTTSAAIPPTPSNMTLNTWKVNSTLFNVVDVSEKIDKNLDTRTYSYGFGGTDGVFIYFKGSETVPAAGVYKLVFSTPKLKDEVSIMAPGFSGYFSKNEFNSYVLVTNANGVLTLHVVDVKVSGFTGGEVILSGKLQLPTTVQ